MIFIPRHSINTNTCNDFKWSTECSNSVNNGLPIISCYNWPSSSKFMGNWHGKIVNIGILKTFDMPFQWASVPIEHKHLKLTYSRVDISPKISVGIDRFLQSRNARYWSHNNWEKEFDNLVRWMQPDRSKCLRFSSSEKSIGSDSRVSIYTILFIKVLNHWREQKKDGITCCRVLYIFLENYV